MQINAAAERLGTALSLLSLDRVLPYFTAMGWTISHDSAQPVKECIRQAIEANRRQFAADQHTVPDLAAHVTAAFERRFGTPGRLALFRWVAEDFIHSAADRAPFVGWHILLSVACRDPSRWSALGLPASISEQSRRYLIEAIDTSDIEKIEDALENVPLSAWDAQMYLIHGFDDEDDDAGMCPFMWVRETVQNHRLRTYIRWLRGQLSERDRQAFFFAAIALKEKIAATQNLPPLRDPFALGKPKNADDN